jgi:hypothetical protein
MPEPLTETRALMRDERVCAAWPDCCAGVRVGECAPFGWALRQAKRAARLPKAGDRVTALRLAR